MNSKVVFKSARFFGKRGVWLALTLIVCFSMLLSLPGQMVQALSNPVSTNFETNTWEGWTVVNGTQTNKWVVNTAAGSSGGGSYAAYVTNNTAGTPPPHTYSTGSASVVHFYRDVTFPAGETIINLAFNWKVDGESSGSYDDTVEVHVVTTATTPTAGTALGTGTRIARYRAEDNWQSANLTLSSAYAGTTQRLVFTWRNDASTGDQPPGAIDNIVITTDAPEPTYTPIANPALGQACGLDVVLVIDSSGSVDSGELAQMKTAFIAFVNAFLPATPTQFAVVEFNTWAEVTQPFTSDVALLTAAINGAPSVNPGVTGYTNFDEGLYDARMLFPNRVNPDMIIFSSDGNPNRRDGHPGPNHDGVVDSVTEAAAMNFAIHEANEAKTDGIHILAIGIGADVDTANLEDISGPGDVITSGFDTLATDLAALAGELCGGTISVYKVIDGDGNLGTTDDQVTSGAPVTGWAFDSANVSAGDSVNPTGIVTASDGSGNLDITMDGDDATLDVEETVKAGYAFIGASCFKQGNVAVPFTLDLDPTGGVGIRAITVAKLDIVSCYFYNTEEVADIEVTKTDGDVWAPRGGQFQYTITVSYPESTDPRTTAVNVVMTDTLDPSVSYVEPQDPVINDPDLLGPICTEPLSGGGGTFSCTVASMDEGESYTVSFWVQVLESAPMGGLVEVGECTTNPNMQGAFPVDVCNLVSVTTDTTEADYENNDDSEPKDIGKSTAITLVDFTATGASRSVILAWQTGSETDNAGFNIYRANSLKARKVLVNPDFILSTAAGSPTGASYEFTDVNLPPNKTYYYWLEDVDAFGITTLHGPYKAKTTK